MLSQGTPNTLLAWNQSTPVPTAEGGLPLFRSCPPGGPPTFGGTLASGAGGASGGYYLFPSYGNAQAASFSMLSHIKNAVRMIQPVYQYGSSVDKARTFWEAFERATEGLAEPLRLSAFRE
ncbi:hypothetical protein PC128_g25324 [Phytophthora cactorum]|nr:hypothetical protein PC128_g25324 [Phytophthora cactorum]KAG4042140.1 hypothetical protein PC123_g22367 [Phytophthora cactorum]